MILKARYIVPVDSPVIVDGAVAFEHGVITAIGAARNISGADELDYDDAVICPGFVNGHTHLELSHLANRVPPSPDFTDWLRRLMAETSSRPPDQASIEDAVRHGIDQSVRAGVTAIGDITRFPVWTRVVLARSPLRAVSFGEVIAIGKRRTLLEERVRAAFDLSYAGDRLAIGVSPHAPYTVEPEGMSLCAARAESVAAPLCIHLAETEEEEAFTRSGRGPFVEYLKALRVWDEAVPTSGCGPIELANRTGLLTARTVVAHANYVSKEDIRLLATTGASVAYCPRTHDAFGHPPHRFLDMLAAGVNVCVCTDSLASNPSLSVLDELRFVQRARPDVPSDLLLAMGTLFGARALGLGDRTGSIRIGKRADLAVIPLEPQSASDWRSIFEIETQPVAVVIDGNLVDPPRFHAT